MAQTPGIANLVILVMLGSIFSKKYEFISVPEQDNRAHYTSQRLPTYLTVAARKSYLGHKLPFFMTLLSLISRLYFCRRLQARERVKASVTRCWNTKSPNFFPKSCPKSSHNSFYLRLIYTTMKTQYFCVRLG